MSTALVLPAEMSIYNVAELRAQWLAWLDAAPAEGPGCVDASAVAEVDAAGLQLLQPSTALQGACQALGMQSLLARAV